MIKDVFPENIANLILQMRLIQHGEDTLIWEPNRSRDFSVKYAYKTINNEFSNRVRQQSSISKETWRNLWRTKVPHKIKLIIWKCLRNIVPTLTKISHYKRGIDTKCPFCNSQDEDIQHLLIDYEFARALWLRMNVNVAHIQQQNIHVATWILSWFQTASQSKHTLVWLYTLMCTAWYIWKSRCSKLFQDKRVSCWFSCHEIRSLIQNCMDSNQQNHHISTQFHIKTWVPPRDNCLKLNINASFDYNTKEIGVGLILRGSAGSAKGIRGRYFNGGMNVEQAECMAMKEAILWAHHLNLNNVTLESDCRNLVNAISSVSSTVQWLNKSYVEEIRHLLCSVLSFGVVYVNRSANNVAHVIAKEARGKKTSFDFGETIPTNFEKLVRDEKKLM
ncbi:uncharacterized protein LOC113358942 [Papaver somniferum]|uniref:uncharacterized protein LOC113358942 n=1 Tax=Papaver somniferum TaxID=3469 RepID=UPI000E702694|nr:uncharacterized protein LOC113358942 [Papaver somniferum]